MSQMATEAHLTERCNKASGSPDIAQAPHNPAEPAEKPSSVITPVDCSVAIDPIKYVRVPPSFDGFKPDGNIIDKDGMPGKPSLPAGSVFGSFSHFMILSSAADEVRLRALRWGSSRSGCELDSFRSDHSCCYCAVNNKSDTNERYAAASVALGHHNLNPELSSRHDRPAARQMRICCVHPQHRPFASRVGVPR